MCPSTCTTHTYTHAAEPSTHPATHPRQRHTPNSRRLDPAPYITLRLRDSEVTRAIWPHKFELLYKVRARAALCPAWMEGQMVHALCAAASTNLLVLFRVVGLQIFSQMA
jgi:hypothetical protein